MTSCTVTCTVAVETAGGVAPSAACEIGQGRKYNCTKQKRTERNLTDENRLLQCITFIHFDRFSLAWCCWIAGSIVWLVDCSVCWSRFIDVFKHRKQGTRGCTFQTSPDLNIESIRDRGLKISPSSLRSASLVHNRVMLRH